LLGVSPEIDAVRAQDAQQLVGGQQTMRVEDTADGSGDRV